MDWISPRQAEKDKSTSVLQALHLQPGAKHPVCMARNQKNSTSLTLGTQTAFDFLRPAAAGVFIPK
jgi:hypothetical protein